MPPQYPPNEPPNNRPPSNNPNDPRPRKSSRDYQPMAPSQPPQPPPRLQPGQLFSTPEAQKKRASRRTQPPAQPDPNSYRARPAQSEYAKPRPRPARAPRRSFRWGPFLGYTALTTVIVVILGVLFVATRVFSSLGSISVPRQDTNGQVITGSSITGHGRVNIALLGIDRRPNDDEGTRTDTMIIVSVDQDNKTASMLSIPRDLWVPIPGHGNNRINTAYFFGDQDRPDQGGPPLFKQAVLEDLGIKVDYFIEVDFNGFQSIVDALGGITIDVKKPLIDNQYPTEDYGIKRIYIPAGIQRMDGQTALEYARSRHQDSDLGRNQRQQDVILAVRQQGINLGLITNTQLQTALQGAVKTDLTPGDMLSLGQMAIGIKISSIKQFAIDANITQNVTIDGNDVLQADPTALNQLVQQFLGN